MSKNKNKKTLLELISSASYLAERDKKSWELLLEGADEKQIELFIDSFKKLKGKEREVLTFLLYKHDLFEEFERNTLTEMTKLKKKTKSKEIKYKNKI